MRVFGAFRFVVCVAFVSAVSIACSATDDGGSHTTVITSDASVSTPTSDAGSGRVDAATEGDANLEAAAERDILVRVRELPHVVTATEYFDSPDASRKRVPAGYRRIDIGFDQPADHTHPEGVHFVQRLSLLHRTDSAPMVLATSGYQLSTGRSELAVAFAANQLQVEHRYFQSSTPSPRDWSLLTVKQSADDSHSITEAFKGIYRAKWVNTGGSKGGETAVFHRRFYPSDVDATVAYVAPIVFGLADSRFPPFIDAIGGSGLDGCRSKLRAFQRELLRRRDEIEPTLTGSYTRLGGLDVAYEHAVIETIFAFFQYGEPDDPQYGCAAIPEATATTNEIRTFFEDMGALEGYVDDASLAEYDAYNVQVSAELGSYAMNLAPLADLLAHANTYTADTYLPPGVRVTYRPETMTDVASWVKTSGERILFIYGEYDPWSAAAYDPGAARDSYRFNVAKGNHGAYLQAMQAADQMAAREALERWLAAPIVAGVGDSARAEGASAFEGVVGEEERPRRRR